MSASRDKAKRQNEMSSEKYLRKLEKENEAARETKRFNLITKIVVAVVAVFALVVILFSSGVLYNVFTAVEIGDSRFTVNDVNYYYQTIYTNYYNNYYSQYGEYASYFIPEEDDLKEEAYETMQEVAMLCTEAKKAGFEMSEDDLADVEAEVSSIESAAENYGVSTKAYLNITFGKGMTLKRFKSNVEDFVLASAYGEYLRDNYEYENSEVMEYYDEHADEMDLITARVFMIAADQDDEGNYDLSTSNAKAEKFLAALTDEQSFIDLAYEYAVDDNKESYEEDDATLSVMQGENLNELYKEWMLDASRKTGDKTSVEASSGTYVVYFVSRDNNNYPTIDVRHILIKFESTNDDGTVDEDVKQAAYEEAERIYDEWKAGEATEESFTALADEYNQDSAEGGLYEYVYKDQMVQPFNDWCFSTSRKTGDTGIVETEFGYHVVYFVGTNDNYNYHLAKTELINRDFSAWEEGLKDTYKVTKTLLANMVG